VEDDLKIIRHSMKLLDTINCISSQKDFFTTFFCLQRNVLILFTSVSMCQHLCLIGASSTEFIGLGAFAASELDKVFSGYQPR
jgi:hypothetical protein